MSAVVADCSTFHTKAVTRNKVTVLVQSVGTLLIMSAEITRNMGNSVLGRHNILITPPTSRICIETGACSPCFSLRVCRHPPPTTWTMAVHEIEKRQLQVLKEKQLVIIT